ncbi:MAG: hypothetical protein EPN55_07445 [Gammaproteobacteria bacterium]|nr:MAG: hypothetical protein EPN55_07445 [Gammaproteobacteria bacterium]
MIFNLKKRIYFLTVSVAMLVGCYQGFESQPHIDANPHWQIKGKRLLVGPDIEIFMRVSNYRTRFYNNDHLHYFGISFWFDPKVPGYRFDPQITFLELRNRSLHPKNIKLVFSGLDARVIDWECGNYPEHDFGSGPNYGLFRGACFELYFPVSPPSSDTPFSIKIEGLTLNGAPVRVPVINFKEGTFRAFM